MSSRDAQSSAVLKHNSRGENRVLVAVVGGNLQGVEVTYLACKAGWRVRVIDKNDRAAASGLCDSFLPIDVTVARDLTQACGDVDLLIPALEDDTALASLTRWSRLSGVPFAFDPDAYIISSSKLESAALFSRCRLPVPAPWPDCGFPVLAKPSKGSGSKGVKIFHDRDSLEDYFRSALPPHGWVLQQYLPGSQHSLEVIGLPGHYRALQVTDLYVDENFDCKRVVAPTALPPKRVAEFENQALTLAAAIDLHGIMDVEAILHDGKLKVLEIDARFPSQTPTAVYWSTGKNMVQLLGQLFSDRVPRAPAPAPNETSTIYEHIRVSPGLLEVGGEHIMAGQGPLFLRENFFGADEAITNFSAARDSWSATLIIAGADRAAALAKRDRTITQLAGRFSIKKVLDRLPAD